MEEIVYTPGQVWSVVSGEVPPTVEELSDLRAGLLRLEAGQRTFLYRISQGYSVKESMRLAGLSGNQTRLRREIVARLVEAMNGVRS